jgi:hypothetical protein
MNHDQLQAAAFQWAHNTYPQIRGCLFACLNEIKKLPSESRTAHMIRVQQAKAIGLRPGVLDLLLLTPVAVYGFDAKVGSDRLSERQLDFCKILDATGGGGFEFRNLEQFQCIFSGIIRNVYGSIN